MNYYTGVGSRQTPVPVVAWITLFARKRHERGTILRSGGAWGADTAFESGHESSTAHIYLPWARFNGRVSARLNRPSLAAYTMAAEVHPAWARLSSGAQSLHARNCHQVLGDDLKTPSDFLVCWTPDGCESEATRTRETGGTATAIVLADRNKIPVFNLKNAKSLIRLRDLIDSRVL